MLSSDAVETDATRTGGLGLAVMPATATAATLVVGAIMVCEAEILARSVCRKAKEQKMGVPVHTSHGTFNENTTEHSESG